MNQTDIQNLKLAVSDQPELLAIVNELEVQQRRYVKLLFDLGRLDDALLQRIHMFESLIDKPYIGEIANNCQQLLTVISSFINMAAAEPQDRAKTAESMFNDLMKRMK